MTDNTEIKPLNGAQLAILNNRLEGIAQKMANTLMRTGRSGVLNRAKDFSCCIVTADCRLIATADSLPIHVLSGADHMARVMKEFHPDFQRGDAFMNNSPYHGCSHPADHTLLVPVIDDAGDHRFTVLAKAHQADIGNSIPTTYHGAAVDVYEEGALIFPSVKVQDNFEDNMDFVRMCEMRIRVPGQWRGDYLAMVGSCRIGERELVGLIGEVGWPLLEQFVRQWFDYSENRMIEAIGRLQSGTQSASSTHDHFPGTPEEGIRITSTVSIDSAAARIEVDLRDNPEALPCGLNLSQACAETAAMVGVFNSIDHTVPKNAGSFRRIDIRLRENSVCGIPSHPTSCSVATTNVADRVANSTQMAIAEISEGAGMAEVGAVIAPSAGVISGVDPRNGEPYVNQVFLGFTAGAASPFADAWVTTGHVGNGGMCFLDSVELAELYQPILVYDRHILADTAGAGQQVGANCAYIEFGPVGGPMDVGYVSDGVTNGPKGARGGQSGGCADQYLLHPDSSKEPLPACAQITIEDGQHIVAITTGGGGYGPPTLRTPESVALDAAEGLITREYAREVYGVALTSDGVIDEAATAALRRAG